MKAFIWVIVGAVLIAVIFGMIVFLIEEKAVSKGIIGRSPYLAIGCWAVGVIIGGWWVIKCLRQVGTKDRPAQAVIARWGANPKRVVGPGLCTIFWPIENIKLFPTHQYQLNFQVSEVQSKEEGEHRTAVLIVDTAIYIMWPRWDREYEFPNGSGQRISGKDILLKYTYFGLPARTTDAQELKDFFELAVIDAVRRAMVKRNHRKCREKKEAIEEEIKKYLLSEPGNPFKECGIPADNLDVAITSIKFTEAMAKAFSAPEVGKREAEGEKAYLEASVKVLTDAGVSPALAAMVGRKGVKEGLSASELRDFVLIAKLLGADLSQLFRAP